MIESELALAVLVEHALDPREPLEDGPDRRDVVRVGHVDVGHLVIGDGEGAGRSRVEVLGLELRHRLEEAGIIRKRVAVLDHRELGIEVTAFVSLNLSQHGEVDSPTASASSAVDSDASRWTRFSSARSNLSSLVGKIFLLTRYSR